MGPRSLARARSPPLPNPQGLPSPQRGRYTFRIYVEEPCFFSLEIEGQWMEGGPSCIHIWICGRTRKRAMWVTAHQLPCTEPSSQPCRRSDDVELGRQREDPAGTSPGRLQKVLLER